MPSHQYSEYTDSGLSGFGGKGQMTLSRFALNLSGDESGDTLALNLVLRAQPHGPQAGDADQHDRQTDGLGEDFKSASSSCGQASPVASPARARTVTFQEAGAASVPVPQSSQEPLHQPDAPSQDGPGDYVPTFHPAAAARPTVPLLPPSCRNIEEWGRAVLTAGRFKDATYAEATSRDIDYGKWLHSHRPKTGGGYKTKCLDDYLRYLSARGLVPRKSTDNVAYSDSTQ